MYLQSSGGSAGAHMIVKRPIVGILAAGVVAAGVAVGGNKTEPPKQPIQIEQSYKVPEMVVPSAVLPADLSSSTRSAFEAIKMAESDNKPVGQHPDGMSYGPAGLTKKALIDVIGRKHTKAEYRKILNDPELSTRYAEIYFNRLVRYYKGNEDLAIIAYHHGIGNVDKRLKSGKPMYKDYLNLVNKYRYPLCYGGRGR